MSTSAIELHRPAVVYAGMPLPALFVGESHSQMERVAEFFAATIRNLNTRRAYLRGAQSLAEFCEARGVRELSSVRPMHVSAWVEVQTRRYSAPMVKQQLAAVRMLFDWLVVGQVLATNPAAAVRGPKHSIARGVTPVLDAASTRELLNSIDTTSDVGRRDRAIIGTMFYSLARIGAVIQMAVGDYYYQGHRAWLRLSEKGGKQHQMPVHHALHDLLEAYLDGAGIKGDESGVLFRSAKGRSGKLAEKPLSQADTWRMLQRRAKAAGIKTKLTNHTFRATGITEYLSNGGKLEVAQRMANHSSPRTTSLYDRREDLVGQDEIERIRC